MSSSTTDACEPYPITLPPLRRRRSDIPLLLDHFTQQATREGYRFSGIREEAMVRLVDYRWPGNVRELQSAVHFALIKSRGAAVADRHLPAEVRESSPISNGGEELSAQVVEYQRVRGHLTDSGPRLSVDQVRIALDKSLGNKVKAAQILGVGRATLYRFLKNNPL